ncbi:uncharacterized protein LOC129327648 [Eublepharis macularius]|uniref:Uncharacterized protein LOC129327648 n=1 Tax=Eublepharis macularius TaxID=481883 RepID=A0AA97J7L6_EUBMA|nr:uncharacterized protein LOC129327648 [Eublepharis macularius]
MALRVSSHQNFGTFNTMPTQGTSGSNYLPPPPYTVSDHGGQSRPVQQNWNISTISEGEAREAFLEYASSNCCYSSNPPKEMMFEDIQSFNTYRYRLETFTESRFFEWKSKPFKEISFATGTFSVPVTDVTALLPWDIPVTIPKMFINDTKEIMIPSTSSVKECSVCKSSGKIACESCDGRLREQCHWCNGTGLFIHDTCRHCSGTGLSATTCRACSGHGKINCNRCSGHGLLLMYNALVVKWENNISEHVSYQRKDFPAKRFQEVTGQKLFVDEQDMVYPIINFPDSSINNSSRNAIEKHRAQFVSTSRIIRQKQTIEQILLTRVEYTWHDKSHSFYVYGNEHKVYTEDYPQTCCFSSVAMLLMTLCNEELSLRTQLPASTHKLRKLSEPYGAILITNLPAEQHAAILQGLCVHFPQTYQGLLGSRNLLSLSFHCLPQAKTAMEKESLLGDKSCVRYGSDHLSTRIAQGASDPCSAYEGASAPPFEMLDNSSTDEKKRLNDTGDKPGPAVQLTHEEHEEFGPHHRDLHTLSVSEQDVKEALLQYVSSKHFYRTAPAKHMKVQNIKSLNTYRYRLESFTETRETYLASELYDGGFIDSRAVAPPPAPWEIVVDPPPLFTDCEMHIPVPHTYSVESCPNCKGRGATVCLSCGGTGKKTCCFCNGSGFNFQEDSNICSSCAGSGMVRCFKCHSNGWLKCYRCNGSGVLLFHTELTITWKNNVSEHVVDRNSGFPIYHLQKVTGKEIFMDEHSLVYPIVNFPEPSIDEGSRACIEQHRIQCESESRILRQKQTVEMVPVTKVEYEWKGKLRSFYVLGNEKKVYAKDYPGKCCCSVM